MLPPREKDAQGTHQSGLWRLNGPGNFTYGNPSDLGFKGDWRGNFSDGIGVFQNGAVHLRYTPSTGYGDISFSYGIAGDIPVAGRWAIPCAPGSTQGGAGISGLLSACQLQPSPTATASTLDSQLANYGITTIGNWTQTDKQAMLDAAIRTGGAFAIQFAGSTIERFKHYMYRYGRTTIRIIKSTTSGQGICVTETGVNPPFEAEITCDANNQFTEYTAVHEFGHVFVGRTGGFNQGSTYYGLINIPQVTQGAGTPGILFDSTGGIVFGLVSNDWVRGGRGWGSGEATPPGTPCPFQQHPFKVTDTAPGVLPATRVAEVNEAAADMFLNWVFSVYGSYIQATSGFRDISWLISVPCLSGTPQPTERPGQARLNYLSTIAMPTLNAIITTTLTATP
ncbi:MAG: hypothetical protein U0528_14510 [Anaerolineae bacterium]